MAKRKTLTDVEVFYIKQNPEKQTAEQLAEKFNVSSDAVERIFQEVESSKKKAPTTLSQAMEAGRKRRKGKVVASVMVPAAAQISDYLRPKGDQLDKLKNCIHKPMGEE